MHGMLPALFVFLAIRNFLQDEDFSKALNLFFWACLFFVGLELLFFGFRVTIEGNYLTYRRSHGIFARPVRINRQDVVDVKHTYFDSRKKIKTASILVHTRDPATPRLVMHLAGFSPTNVRAIVAWLEQKERVSLGRTDVPGTASN